MTTTAFWARDKRREKLVKRNAPKRAELKAKIINDNLSDEERRDAMFKLQKMPRDSAKVRIQKRCGATGHPRAVYRKFRLNRIMFRQMALAGLLPGVTKASW